jgi:hypothetical protein
MKRRNKVFFGILALSLGGAALLSRHMPHVSSGNALSSVQEAAKKLQSNGAEQTKNSRNSQENTTPFASKILDKGTSKVTSPLDENFQAAIASDDPLVLETQIALHEDFLEQENAVSLLNEYKATKEQQDLYFHVMAQLTQMRGSVQTLKTKELSEQVEQLASQSAQEMDALKLDLERIRNKK